LNYWRPAQLDAGNAVYFSIEMAWPRSNINEDSAGGIRSNLRQQWPNADAILSKSRVSRRSSNF